MISETVFGEDGCTSMYSDQSVALRKNTQSRYDCRRFHVLALLSDVWHLRCHLYDHILSYDHMHVKPITEKMHVYLI